MSEPSTATETEDGARQEAFLAALGRRVRTARARRGMSRRHLAGASGVSERYLAQLEGGSGNISVLLLRQVAEAIGVSLQELLAAPDETDGEILTLTALARAASVEQRARMVQAVRSIASEGPGFAKGRRIALVGLRGAGKSTLGRLLAEDLELPFVELHAEITAESGLAVAEIFALYGQDGFRRFEQHALRSLIDRHSRAVLAVGGGIVAEPATYESLLSAFHTVWVKASPAEHMARVLAQGDRRPMAGNPAAMEELRAILASREQLYARAEAVLDTAGKSVEACRVQLLEIVRVMIDLQPAGQKE